MTSTAKMTRNHAFVLTGDHVKKTWGLFSDQIGTVRARIQCKDEIERTFEITEKLLEYENAHNKMIGQLKLEAYSDDFKKKAHVTFGGYIPIEASIEASESEVTRLRDELSDVLSNAKAWYSAFAMVPFLAIAIAFPMIAFMFLWITSPYISRFFNFSEASSTLMWFATVVILIVIGGCGALFDTVRERLFPKASFAIGQGLQRYDNAERIRWAIVIAFLVSLSASTVVSLIT